MSTPSTDHAASAADPRPHDALRGRRIMIVEDEVLIAMLIEEILVDQGCTIVGLFSTLATALVAARSAELEAAILDVNLNGKTVYPVAEVLEKRGIPFVLLSGHGAGAIPAGRSGWVACAKPFKPGDLSDALARCLG